MLLPAYTEHVIYFTLVKRKTQYVCSALRRFYYFATTGAWISGSYLIKMLYKFSSYGGHWNLTTASLVWSVCRRSERLLHLKRQKQRKEDKKPWSATEAQARGGAQGAGGQHPLLGAGAGGRWTHLEKVTRAQVSAGAGPCCGTGLNICIERSKNLRRKPRFPKFPARFDL